MKVISMVSKPPLVIVTPVYEDSIAVSRLLQELEVEVKPSLYVIAVDDGSIRKPISAVILKDANVDGVIVTLNRNMGHQRAIGVGLNYAAEHYPESTCIVMDSDGEDPPAHIKFLIDGLVESDVDVVVAKRTKRQESLQFKLFYFLYKIIFALGTGRVINFGNFMALKPNAVRRVTSMHELWTHLAACVLTSKLRTKYCALDRGSRYAGRSKMNFSGLVLHGFRAFMVFAEDVLVRVGIACAALALLSVVAIFISIGLKSIGMATPGWFSVSLGILVLMLLQTSALTLVSLLMTGILRSNAHIKVDYKGLVSKYEKHEKHEI